VPPLEPPLPAAVLLEIAKWDVARREILVNVTSEVAV
jgi:hypothetical protein